VSRAPAAARTVALAALLALCPAVARAGTEEFSTFHLAIMEEDDESVMDHLLARTPLAWRGDWERSASGFRTVQGCLTSGQWFMDNQIRVQSPLGKQARFNLEYNQVADDISSYEFLDLWFKFALRGGMLGAMFRPMYDKSRQDFALAWELGADSSAFQLRAIYGFEDLFNNLWAWRQSRVGNVSEPYLRHPWEPALVLASRHEHWRVELSGKYLTPSLKEVAGPTPAVADHHTTLWGTLADVNLEAQALGFRWQAGTHNKQARSTDQPIDHSTDDDRNFRRGWTAEAAARRPLSRRLEGEVRYAYMERTETWGPPTGPGSFFGIDRTIQTEALYRFSERFAGRLGYLHDQITIDKSGYQPTGTEGTRKESRAYFGLDARFGRVRISGVEGIELDLEPYPVYFHHDKSFITLQTTF
jgi:hypothetical protein